MAINAERIQEVFLAAAELEGAAERARFLDGACDGDAGLRARVEALPARLIDDGNGPNPVLRQWDWLKYNRFF